MVSVPPVRPGRAPLDEIPPWLTRPPVDLELIVPAYNEARRLPSTLADDLAFLAGRPWSSAVVVVDNDSADGTLDALRPFEHADVPLYGIGCSDHGKGAAVRRGIATSSARFVGFADADNATPIGTLDTAVELLEAGVSAVIASRRAPGAHYEVEQSAARRCGGWVFRRLTRLALPGIADTQCGFKFFDGPLVREAVRTCHVDGFAFDVEILAHLLREGRTVVEVPVNWTDIPGSTFSARRHGLRSMTDIIRISVSR
ncbi:glycosyltransferase [Streptomyces ficellus]|uniref:Glycosyltransferase n=1 Tax=Streptomyces ficellus TaxID=1977088 RepID=A0A6I6F5H9_9ACTN|nr:glycosyltransferase [Streptomyces ficellus]QGV78004.1 glycosyltransferase [Streptomyces ficellus]